MQCQNCGSNVGIVVPHPNLNNTIILMANDHCSYDFITTSYLNHNPDIWTTILTFDRAQQKWPVLSPKKAKMVAKKKTFPESMLTWTFCKKTGSKLVNFGLRGPICILHPPIEGYHPVPCLSTKIIERQGTAMYYFFINCKQMNWISNMIKSKTIIMI